MQSSTRLFPLRGPLLGVAVVSLTLAVAMVAGCGGSEIAFTPVEGTESAYCATFRAWQVHELDGDGDDQPNPAALESTGTTTSSSTRRRSSRRRRSSATSGC